MKLKFTIKDRMVWIDYRPCAKQSRKYEGQNQKPPKEKYGILTGKQKDKFCDVKEPALIVSHTISMSTLADVLKTEPLD